MKKVKRFLAVILAAAMALALLSACSSSNDGGNPGANNTPGTSNNANRIRQKGVSALPMVLFTRRGVQYKYFKKE